jgi:4-azaleucine resistance transporter AzlC
VESTVDGSIRFNVQGALDGMRQSVPLLIAVFSYGIVFGVLARQAGMTLVESMMMSGLVFAGASQFASLDLWNAPLPVITIVITTLAVNLRFVLMGASLRPWFHTLSAGRTYGSVFFMGDESWALTMREFNAGGNNAAILIGSGLAQLIAWVASTSIGHTLGQVIQNPEQWGLDFVFTAAFAALLVGMWKKKSDLLPWSVAAILALAGSLWLPGKWYILLGGLGGSLSGLIGARDAD